MRAGSEVLAARPPDAAAAPVPAPASPWADALPGLLAVAAGLALAVAGGGYAPDRWYAAGLFLLALLLMVVLVAPPAGGGRPSLAAVAGGFFAAYAGWSLLSIIWAQDAGAAWEGGNRAVVYSVALTVLLLRPWRYVAAAGAVWAVVAGVSLIAVGVLVATAVQDDPASLFLEGRLAAPIDYANASSNLWLIGLFPALWAATAPDGRWWSRALGLAAACLLLQVALLSQSRGGAVAFAIATVAWLALSPRRFPSLLALAAVGALTALGFGRLTEVRSATSVAELQASLGDARRAIVVACLIAAVAGGAAALAGRRTPRSATGPRARRAGDLAVVALGLAAVVAAVAAVGDPGRWLDDRWQDFKTTGYQEVEAGTNRYGGSLGSGRYDYWRVALQDLRDRPLTGRGADNFAVSYLRERRNLEAPQHPHSLAMRILGQTGLIGAALFSAFLLLGAAAVVRARRRASLEGRALIAGAAAGFVAWLIHAQVDWLWVFPGLVIPALALLAVAARLDAHPAPTGAPGPRGRAPADLVRVGGAGLLILGAVASLAVAGLAARFTSAAFDDFAENPRRTLARLDRAAALNRLSGEALLARGILARRLGRDDVALADIKAAVRREPFNWFAQFELALQHGAMDQRPAARAAADRARALNPRQAVIDRLQTDLRLRDRVVPADYEAILQQQIRRRLTPVAAAG